MVGDVIIYTLECPLSNKIKYIGKTMNLKLRLYNHINKSKNKKTYKDKWVNSLIIKGHKPIMNVLDIVNENEWEFWEKFYISLFKSWGFSLTNHTEGGDGGSFKKHSIETIKKMSNKIPWNKGIPFSEDVKKKMSESGKVKVFTKTHLENMSKSLKGKKRGSFNEEWKRNISKSKLNTIMSEETKEKLRNTSPKRKKIICTSTNIIYNSISEASRLLKIPVSTINGVLKKRRKLAHGLLFNYYND